MIRTMRLAIALTSVLWAASPAQAQKYAQNPESQRDLTATRLCTYLDLREMAAVSVAVDGTFSGTVTWTVAGAESAGFQSLAMSTTDNTNNGITSTTSTGLWTAPVSALRILRACLSAAATGTATVTLSGSTTGGGAAAGEITGSVTVDNLSQDATHDSTAQTTGPQEHCYANDANPTAVADADAVRVWCDQNGRVVTSPYSANANWVKGHATQTADTETSIVAAQGAGVSFCATTIVVSNSSATAIVVAIEDGAGGATLMTIPAAANMGGAVITLPVPLCTSANTALYFDPSAAATTIAVTAVGFKATL